MSNLQDIICDKKYQDILSDRAKILSKEIEEIKNSKEEMVAIFKCGEKSKFAIYAKDIETILLDSMITSVPKVKPHIKGITYHQGQIITILDIDHFFKIEREGYSCETYTVIMSINRKKIAFLVDNVLDLEVLEANDVTDKSLICGDDSSDYNCGLYKGEIILLDVKAIVDDTNLILET